MNTRKKILGKNQQDRQKITFNPKEISQQCTPATHTEAVHCQRVLFHPCL